MAIKKASIAPLEAWQERYLASDGRRLPYEDFSPWPTACYYFRLFDGEGPPLLDPAKARHPSNLWKEYGGEFLAAFIARNPGTRPLPWWTWDAPDAANPADQGSDPDHYQKAVAQAQRRSRWTPEKQAAFLHKHGLLQEKEKHKIIAFNPQT
ncbi:hypothetical protein [Desulfatitalea alkaliphila]|uniref:Uncharacterized protein n=1 Tax=Desulfatitalea alkaliphila TaxID=2929485 RepID=A0AA41R4P4_9BACT|nr:hypothetical protein [Desulfatitalea alkaliphila]MCJ8501025.1 hypothetical protein [Desulfatitalea alkaliphila]